MRQWPTASATDWKGSSQPGQRRGQLSEVETKWTTPTQGQQTTKYAQGGTPLACQVLGQPALAFGPPDPVKTSSLGNHPELWFTPTVPGGGQVNPTGMLPNGKKQQVGLKNQAQAWPTPVSQSAKGGPHGLRGGAGSAAMIPPEMLKHKLNPDWVETLMGLAIGHTRVSVKVPKPRFRRKLITAPPASRPSAMASYPKPPSPS